MTPADTPNHGSSLRDQEDARTSCFRTRYGAVSALREKIKILLRIGSYGTKPSAAVNSLASCSCNDANRHGWSAGAYKSNIRQISNLLRSLTVTHRIDLPDHEKALMYRVHKMDWRIQCLLPPL